MRNYAVVAPTFWTGSTGRVIRRLGSDTQVVALYLISGPNSTMIGLYYMPLPTLCHETGCSMEGASKALRSLGEVGFCRYDDESEYVWIPEMAKWQIGARLDIRDKRVKAVHRSLIACFNSPFVSPFIEKYGKAYHLNPLEIVPREIKAAPKPLRSQEQEQEQEQDQEQDQKNVSSERSRKTRDRSKPTATRRSRPTTEGKGETIATIPLANGSEAPVTADIVAEWQKAFPGVDVHERLKHIRVYFLTNPKKRKTAAGIGKCITGWLAREQDRGRSPNIRRDDSGAPLPPKSKTEVRDVVDAGEFIREEYNVETGEVIKRYPHPFRKESP